MNSSKHRISVGTSLKPYEIVVGVNGIREIGEELKKAGFKEGTKILVVTNQDVADPYSDLFLSDLISNGFKPKLLIIEAGEKQKTIQTISIIHDAAFSAGLERGSLMIALGGGVVGDMTGFAAATWLRGISVVQVPTTLLAMVDASIGGKTGVNHLGGKNLIGSFHQPKLVLIDPLTLKTLPTREFRAGMAEVIKYGIIGDNFLFKYLEELPKISSLSDLDQNKLETIIHRSALSKARVVESDEKESGMRAILNYGHTFGHVIENLSGYGKWLHGEAVSIGMVAAGQLALQLKFWKEEDYERQYQLLKKVGLPTKWPSLGIEDVLRTIKGDKKVKDSKITFILPSSIGNVLIRDDVSEAQIKECIRSIMN